MGHLVYDADCGFCTRSARWLDESPVAWHTVDLDAVHVTRAEADANAGYLEDGKVTALGADAIIAALRAKQGGGRVLGALLATPGIRRIAHLLYPRIAANRHRMPGGTAACKFEPPGGAS